MQAEGTRRGLRHVKQSHRCRLCPRQQWTSLLLFCSCKRCQSMTLAFFFLCVAAVVGTSCIQCQQQRTQRSERAGVASWRAKASCRHTDRPQTDSDWSSWLHPPFQHFCRGRNGKHFSCSRKLHLTGLKLALPLFFFFLFFPVSNNYLLQ